MSLWKILANESLKDVLCLYSEYGGATSCGKVCTYLSFLIVRGYIKVVASGVSACKQIG